MTNLPEQNDDDEQQNLKPVKEWSDDKIKAAKKEVVSKHPEDWTDNDRSILWEWASRQWNEYISKLEDLKNKPEFNLEEWVRFQTEVLVDIYYVVKLQEHNHYYEIGGLASINASLHSIGNNIRYLAVPPPTPPAVGNLYGIDKKLNEILKLLGGGGDYYSP